MAYTRTKAPQCPVSLDPGVVGAFCKNTITETNMQVRVPWNNVKLAYAYTIVNSAIDATGACEVDLEVARGPANAIGGTEVGSAQLAASSAVGDVDEFTLSSETDRMNLNIGDMINVEIDGSATGTGSFMLYLYFEAM